jgi:hypothetical protein
MEAPEHRPGHAKFHAAHMELKKNGVGAMSAINMPPRTGLWACSANLFWEKLPGRYTGRSDLAYKYKAQRLAGALGQWESA